LTKRNGYELEPGTRWLFIGNKHDFPDGPEEVEIKDIQRGEVRVQFVDGRLAGKLEWHRPSKLSAPIDHVGDVEKRLRHEREIADAALSEAEDWAVLTVGWAFGDEILHGTWRFGSDCARVADLLDTTLDVIASVPLAEPDEGGRWHLPGRHAMYLARRLCERYPELVHDHAAVDLDRIVTNWGATVDSDPPSFYQNAYLLICSWCRVDPDCDRLSVLRRQRAEIQWLYRELMRTVDQLGEHSTRSRTAAVGRIKEHYHLDNGDEISSESPGLR
jgi:hypothetical protein